MIFMKAHGTPHRTMPAMSALPSFPPPAPAGPAAGGPARGAHGAGLRTKLNLVLGTLAVLCMAALLWREIDSVRRGVNEEIVAANRVATQLLQRVSFIYQRSGTLGMVEFLQQLGRVRANDITLVDDHGQVLYRSPPATYKIGREAPPWFHGWVAPPLQRQEIRLPDGRLTVEADPSRAILDGWDDLRVLAGGSVLAAALLLAVVFWLVGRTLKPFPTIVGALGRMQQGDYDTRLPALPGREAATIGQAVNRMAAAVQENIASQRRAFEAERRLGESRDLAHRIEEHMEAERREIARELHDELGQSVTAIRALATSLTQRVGAHDAEGRRAAQLIADEAARLYDAMHGMIPRLTPLALDSLGLGDALRDLVDGTRRSHGAIELTLHLAGLDDATAVPPPVALAAYRVVQEALNNALRHSGATRIEIDATVHAPFAVAAGAPGTGGDAPPAADAGGSPGAPTLLAVQVRDDGRGLPPDWQRPGHYGLLGLRERVGSLGGELLVQAAEGSGTRISARLPLGDVTGAAGAPGVAGAAAATPLATRPAARSASPSAPGPTAAEARA
jgi:two-component system sensor histidine kinase UhpB